MCSLPSCSPASLPCCTADSGKCLYVSGIPGTGKTATVLEVMRAMKRKRCGKVPGWHLLGTLSLLLVLRCHALPRGEVQAGALPRSCRLLSLHHAQPQVPCRPTPPAARSEAGEAPPFQFVEINGLRLPSPQHAYSALYEVGQLLPY